MVDRMIQVSVKKRLLKPASGVFCEFVLSKTNDTHLVDQSIHSILTIKKMFSVSFCLKTDLTLFNFMDDWKGSIHVSQEV